MKYIAIIMALVATFAVGDWVMEPEGFEDGVIFAHIGGYPSYWYAPDYNTPMFVYSPGFESDSAVGSGAMSWPDWWGNFIRTPLQDCSSADSVVLSFRMWNTADPLDNDYARFYVWVEPAGYFGTTTISMGPGDARDWELMNIDFTEYAAGQSQVYFYLEANFGTGSFTRECKFDDIGVASSTVLDVEEERDLPQDYSISAYPNPFNSAVTIAIDAPSVETQNLASLQIEIYDVAGRRVAELIPPGPPLTRGEEEKSPMSRGRTVRRQDLGGLTWRPDASVTSGVYLVRALIGNESISKRVVYLK